MSKYPKISVVTITYGHEQYITQMIDSILMQDYLGEIEFIIANDNSPDNTDEVVTNCFSQREIPQNTSVKYTNHKINKGTISNFSWAIAQATGKYIALCEGDDYFIDQLKLQKQVDFLEANPDYSLCFTARSNIDNKGNFISEARFGQQEKWSAEDVLDGGFIAGLQTIVSKNLSKEFNEFCAQFPYRTGADRLYTYFYGTRGKLKYIDELTAVYRIHEGGIWSQLNDKQKLIAHIKQHGIFLEEISKDSSHLKQLKRNMFRLVVSDLYFKFFKESEETTKTLFFIIKTYKINPVVFLLAFKDYSEYYIKLLESKFKFRKV